MRLLEGPKERARYFDFDTEALEDPTLEYKEEGTHGLHVVGNRNWLESWKHGGSNLESKAAAQKAVARRRLQKR